MTSRIEKLCIDRNIKLTENRKIVARVISESKNHPNVEELYNIATKIKPNIGIATVYRTVKMFEEEGITYLKVPVHDYSKTIISTYFK